LHAYGNKKESFIRLFFFWGLTSKHFSANIYDQEDDRMHKYEIRLARDEMNQVDLPSGSFQEVNDAQALVQTKMNLGMPAKIPFNPDTFRKFGGDCVLRDGIKIFPQVTNLPTTKDFKLVIPIW
jgi:hypothetical protein